MFHYLFFREWKKSFLIFYTICLTGFAFGQNSNSAKGYVRDDKGEPLGGASIVVTNTISGFTSGTSSDSSGYFEFRHLPIGDTYSFTISNTGYIEEKLSGYRIKENSNISLLVKLKAQVTDLDEVIVIGYGTQRRKDVNAAIVSVNPEHIDKTSQPSIDNLLQGQASGVTVTNSSEPGGGVSVLIRGATSAAAGNGPLVVIDGFPVIYDAVEPGSGNKYYNGGRGALNDINPNDIESIQVLKDAAATSIYGARGSNGVILITTKRAKLGSVVEGSLNTSYQTIARRPQLLTAKEFLVEQNRYMYDMYLQQNKLPPYGGVNSSLVPPFVPPNSDELIANTGNGTDWYDMITQTGKVNQFNLSIARGSEAAKAYFSLNYFEQEGVIKSTGLERVTARFNYDQNIKSWWDYGASISAASTESKNSQLGDGRDADAGIIESALNYSPLIAPERDPVSGKWVEDPKQPLLAHPLSYLDIEDNTQAYRFLGNVFTNFYLTPNKDIWLKFSYGADIRNSARKSYYPTTSRYGSQVNGEANINRAERTDYVSDITLNMNKTLGTLHKLDGVLGYSYQNYNGQGSGARAQDFTTDILSHDAIQAGSQRPVVNSYRDRHVLVSYFSRLQYAFDGKYIVMASGRVDGSDRFGANNRYAFFPSVALAWRLSDEHFLKDVAVVSDLKLRTSLGQVGNENIPNDAASEYYRFDGRNYYFNGNLTQGVNLSKLGNPNLKWETTTEFNVGLDFGFFENRVTGNFDFYYKTIEDLLSYRALPRSSVVGSIPWNIGSTRGHGFEFTLNTLNIVNPLRWNTILTFTAYRDRWVDRDPKVMLQPYQGLHDPMTAVYALVPYGIKQFGESTPTMPSLLPGQQKFKDIDGLDENGNLTGEPDGMINQADVVYMGTQAPRFTAGINNIIEFKNFEIMAFLYASVGALRWPTTYIEHGVLGSYGKQRFRDNFNFLREVKDRWTPDNPSTTMPSGEVNSYGSYGNPYWQNASYLRLKTLSVGYNFPNGFLHRGGIQNLKMVIGAQNLFTITKYTGLDPEAENSRAAYPAQRTFYAGINFKF
ncbi:SusC/RagA family TonB-linked outer membrane protein [Sphingobacterium chuzhouense]|uniref:SusC/RagA family TonB-linked outer membrane protein n=1 Tax=Sphingobacterium chuzhouense TaxID=1742264 RepID=A0ABR7XN46_9SPHI|nr:SusC/RagA family TonB-linked outer membrane protein [Sphingobacterium chuzhouense]MBD1420595.1 SusC/RagA family TonB-linked outer membrane protein [Sphingobacterium chuzhouense]